MRLFFEKIAIFALFIFPNMGHAGYPIYSIERDGVNWIYPEKHTNTFSVTPLGEINTKYCADTQKKMGEDWRYEECRKNPEDLMCDKELMRMYSQTLAFGLVFSRTQEIDDIEEGATTTWEVTGNTGQALDPSLINEYAAQLGLDPRESAVAVVQPDGINLAKKDGEPQFSFRQPKSTDHEGYSYSWLFQEALEIIPERRIYVMQYARNRPYFTLTSYVLNCELSRGASDYLDIQADVKATGIRYYAPKVIDRAYSAYQDLASKSIPAGATKEDRSLLYGYYLARAFDAELVDTIGLKNLASMLFEERAGKIAIKPLADKAEFADAISIVGTHVTQNQRVRLSMTP